jgi:hypothetical protein
VGGEERGRADPESGSGFFLLVAEDFRVGEPGVVIDGLVQIGVPRPGAAVPASLGASQGAVSAAVGDPSEFLDVYMDQITGVLVFIALRCGLSDGQPGALVKAVQSWHPVPGQNAAHGGAGQVEVGSDPVRSPPAAESQRHN